MRIVVQKLEGTCRRCSSNMDNVYMAISLYSDGAVAYDTYCERCLPGGRAVLRNGATSTTVYDVYNPNVVVASYTAIA